MFKWLVLSHIIRIVCFFFLLLVKTFCVKFVFHFRKIKARKVDIIHVRVDCIRVFLLVFSGWKLFVFVYRIRRKIVACFVPLRFPNIRIIRIVSKVFCFCFYFPFNHLCSFQCFTLESYLFPFIISLFSQFNDGNLLLFPLNYSTPTTIFICCIWVFLSV